MAQEEWTKTQFQRRRYVVEDPSLDKARRIELRVLVDGRQLVQVQAREPGMVAFVSKPHDQGFEIEIVEASGVRYTDIRTPTGEMLEEVGEWQLQALGV